MDLCVCDSNVPFTSPIQQDLGQIQPFMLMKGLNKIYYPHIGREHIYYSPHTYFVSS